MLIFLAFFIIGVQDENAKLILLKPDNVPIVGLIMLVHFFLWLSMNQGIKNDKLINAGEKPNEYSDSEDKVLVWPDLVYVELISLVLFMAFLLVWSIGLEAPLEQPADPTTSPNPAKAPWYFLGLQEMLVYFDPWLAGVVFPTLMIIGLMAIPYIDFNKEGRGYFSFKQRRIALSIFLFGWLWLWINLILIGTFLRGPNWNLFGPFEYWDPHKLEVLTNINLSELIYIKLLSTGLPENILLREIFGFLLVFGYFLILPPLLAKTLFKKLHQSLGNFKFGVFIFLLLTLIVLPLKMYLRWILNLKYIIAIPEFFFNI
ncbi:MAG: cytochrome C [Candidatus Neomarinimicrobiota bacterium]|nr:MAG: cytochrome C [Candidatus Neomarinimicrobiota bacterium]